MPITKPQPQNSQITNSTNESVFGVDETNNDQLNETTSDTKETILTTLEPSKKNNGTREAAPMIIDKFGRERVSGVHIDPLYRNFDGRPLMFLRKIDIANKLDKMPIVLQEIKPEYKQDKKKAMIYRDDLGKFILLLSRYDFFDKVTFDTYDELEEGIKTIFGGEKNVEVHHHDISTYNQRPIHQKKYIQTESLLRMNLNREELSIDAKEKTLQEWGISLNFYGMKDIYSENLKKTLRVMRKESEEDVRNIINSWDKKKMEDILAHPNIQKLRAAGAEIPVGKIEELLLLDNDTRDKIIHISKGMYIRDIYYTPFEFLKSLDDASIYKAAKLWHAGIAITMRDIKQCEELTEKQVLDAIKNNTIQKVRSMGLEVSNIPEDIQILASSGAMFNMPECVDKIKTITRAGFKIKLSDIKSIFYMNTMEPFIQMKKNIGKNTTTFKEIQKTRDSQKIQELKERMKKETDITLSIIDDITQALSEKEGNITQRSESRYGYEYKILNELLTKFVYPRIGDMDGETQKTIVLTVAGYIGDCFQIEHFIQSPEYKDNPEKLLCAVRGIDAGCITGGVSVERESGSMVFYVEDESEYMKVYAADETISGENGVYKNKAGKIIPVSGGFSTRYSKIYQLANTVTVVNGSKEQAESPDTKEHELRHSLDNRLMITGPEVHITKSTKKEILAYMLNGLSQEEISNILIKSGGYTYGMNTHSQERKRHSKKIEKSLKYAYRVKESGIDNYLNRLAIIPIDRRSTI